MRPRRDQPLCFGIMAALMLCVWIASASPAAAGLQPGDTELLVSGGTQHDGAQISIFGVELIPTPGRMEETGVVIGLTLDHQITTHLGLELDGAYDCRLGEPYEAAVTTASAGLTYDVNPSDNNVLYLTAGGGAAWFLAADTGIDNDVTGTGMAAIGVKMYFKPRIVLRIDFRLFYVPSPFTDQDLLQRTTIGIGVRF
jgi:Outer membrane protein beta-barrel domain